MQYNLSYLSLFVGIKEHVWANTGTRGLVLIDGPSVSMNFLERKQNRSLTVPHVLLDTSFSFIFQTREAKVGNHHKHRASSANNRSRQKKFWLKACVVHSGLLSHQCIIPICTILQSTLLPWKMGRASFKTRFAHINNFKIYEISSSGL